MFNIDLSLSVLTLSGIVIAAGLIGYGFRSRQIKKKQFKISELRREIVYNHAEILELQRENVALESQIKVSETPVLTLKPSNKDFLDDNQKVSDGSI